jgi:hypothetical protein
MGKHMSIRDFNKLYGDKEDYESRREAAIDTYYQGKDLQRDLAIEGLKNKLKKEDSTIYLDTEVYINDYNQ